MDEKTPRRIVFATNNAHKLAEVRDIMGKEWEVLSLSGIGCHDDIPETGATLEENALIKARGVKERYGIDCFADDTGLEVDSLGGEPGVHSARYAAMAGAGAADHDSGANTALLLQKLQNKEGEGRKARFRTVIALEFEGEEHLFSGAVEGEITASPAGEAGFGYDPVFRPEGESLTFAQMGEEKKNSMSHRRRALDRLTAFFRNRPQT